jgi:hypothetical protein
VNPTKPPPPPLLPPPPPSLTAKPPTKPSPSPAPPPESKKRTSGRIRAPPKKLGTYTAKSNRKRKRRQDETLTSNNGRKVKKTHRMTAAEKKEKARKQAWQREQNKLQKKRIERLQANYKYVRLDRKHTAPRLTLSNDFFTVKGFTGYRLSRCTHGVDRGSWYCEMTINEPGERILSSFQKKKSGRGPTHQRMHTFGHVRRRRSSRRNPGGGSGVHNVLTNMYGHPSSTGMTLDVTKPVEAHARLGWVTNMCETEGPVGMGDGFAYCSNGGYTMNQSIKKQYGQSYGVGDVIGFHLYFDDDETTEAEDGVRVNSGGNIANASASSSFSSSSSSSASSSSSTTTSTTVTPTTSPTASPPVPHRPRVSCSFFVNGVLQGVAYRSVETPLPAPDDELAKIDTSTLTIVQRFNLSQKFAKHKPVVGYEQYFPGISLYGPGSVTFNPGPHFQHTVPTGALPYSSLGPPVPTTVVGLQPVATKN